MTCDIFHLKRRVQQRACQATVRARAAPTGQWWRESGVGPRAMAPQRLGRGVDQEAAGSAGPVRRCAPVHAGGGRIAARESQREWSAGERPRETRGAAERGRHAYAHNCLTLPHAHGGRWAEGPRARGAPLAPNGLRGGRTAWGKPREGGARRGREDIFDGKTCLCAPVQQLLGKPIGCTARASTRAQMQQIVLREACELTSLVYPRQVCLLFTPTSGPTPAASPWGRQCSTSFLTHPTRTRCC